MSGSPVLAAYFSLNYNLISGFFYFHWVGLGLLSKILAGVKGSTGIPKSYSRIPIYFGLRCVLFK